ncbi:hypothetical protein [Mycobacterium alsense]|nr:hypothetical protein [Mycobacterium alsense]
MIASAVENQQLPSCCGHRGAEEMQMLFVTTQPWTASATAHAIAAG